MGTKDMKKAERLNEAFSYIYGKDGITSRSAWADRLKVQRTALSAAMNGNVAYLTKNLFIKVCAAHPNVFSLDYLVDGTGTLLLSDVIQKCKEIHQASPDGKPTIDKVIDDLEALRTDLALELQDIRQIKFELTHEREVLQQITQQLTAELHAIRGSYDIPSAPIHMVADSDKKPK